MCPSDQRTHPFEQENNEGSHHGGVHTEVHPILVTVVCGQVVSPGGPGTEHHHGAPDEHDKVHDGHDTTGHLVDGQTDLLSAVNLAVPLSALLVHLGPGIDSCEIEIREIIKMFSNLQFETSRQIPATYSQ